MNQKNDPNAAEEAEYEEELKKTAETLGIDTNNPNWRERIAKIFKKLAKNRQKKIRHTNDKNHLRRQ